MYMIYSLHSGQIVKEAQCIKSYRYSSGDSLNVHVKHQNVEEIHVKVIGVRQSGVKTTLGSAPFSQEQEYEAA